MPPNHTANRNICFVTGTRAEFGLMHGVLAAIDNHPKLTLQLLATGMHLDPAHGDGLTAIRQAGFKIDRVIPWPSNSGRDRVTNAKNTGAAVAAMAGAFAKMKADIVLVVGDRVEAFAAAAAAHLSGLPVAHVHGGDRAAGQVDDSLRHAISKLSHIHFPATRQSAQRLRKMGEDAWRVHRAGSPALDQIRARAANPTAVREAFAPLRRRKFALLVLHPIDADDALESQRARLVLKAVASIPYDRIVIVYPNNDPGGGGIIRTWQGVKDDRVVLRRDVPRQMFLGLMRDAAVLVGNSSSGIIEAASFGTPVVDIGPRQAGRERGTNVANVPYQMPQIKAVLSRLWNNGKPRRLTSDNIYGGSGAARIIASTLAQVSIDDRLLRKLITY
jgi:GDP/UDP-N,N'-diacetylbacillosamine 2-epimerase (hydrolysing)